MIEQHTPFPWSIYDDSDALAIRIKGQYHDHGGAHIATVLGEANARAILALPELVKALAMFVERVEKNGNWDDGCFYYGATSASELQEPIRLASAALAKVKP